MSVPSGARRELRRAAAAAILREVEKVLVSACLLGAKVRWDARDASVSDERLERWRREGRIVAVCPEVEGGLPVPRRPAELVGGGGADVCAGRARVRTAAGEDVTDAFLRGARAALALARAHGVRVAVLKERSPSCGSRERYDGTFTGALVPGEGVTAALLRAEGVEVFSERELAAADARLRQLEAGAGR